MESPIIVLQEMISVPYYAGIEEEMVEESLSSNEKVSP